MLTDIRYAVRGCRRSPLFAWAAIASLALGIGANIAIFNLMNAVLLRALPVREPGRLVVFALSAPDRFNGSAIPVGLFRQIAGRTTLLEGLAAVGAPPMTLSAGGIAERVDGQVVSENFFATLGAGPAMGQAFTAEKGGCVISYGFWQRRFAGTRDAIGQRIEINGHPLTVTGVTPKGFPGITPDSPADVLVPLEMAAIFQPTRILVQQFGRLKPGVSVRAAQEELDAVYHQAVKGTATRAVLEPGSRGISSLRTQYERPLALLLAVVGLVLLIACANVVNLLLARVSAPSQELAVRTALGANRSRLVRQLLVESLLLSFAGTVLALPLAYWVDRVLIALAPEQVKGSGLIVAVQRSISPDWRMLPVTVGIAIVTGVLCGIAPAIRSTRADLKENGGLRAPGRVSFANGMAVTQVAISFVLLIAAGLFLRSLHNLRSVDLGFEPGRMIMLTIEPRWSGYTETASRNFVNRFLERARTLPGVVAVSPAVVGPLSNEPVATTISVPGYVPLPNDPWRIPEGYASWMIPVNYVGPEYFKAIGTPLVAGRLFVDQDGVANKVAASIRRRPCITGLKRARSASMLSWAAATLWIAKSLAW